MCSHFFYFFFKGPYWLVHHQFCWNVALSPLIAPLWPITCKVETNVLPMAYQHESWTLSKPYGIKVRCYSERFREQLGNLFRTSWEHIGIMMGTRTTSQNFLPPSFPKRKKLDFSLIHTKPFIGRIELLFPKLFVTIIGLC